MQSSLVQKTKVASGETMATTSNKRGKQRFKRREYPKSSCSRCPNATNHLEKWCWKLKRERMGLPNGWQWCTWPKHKNSAHYEHTCNRHAPNYPPIPKIIAAAATTTEPTPAQLQSRVLNMLGMTTPTAVASTTFSPGTGIRVTRPDTQQPQTQQDFRPARSIPTNAATCGPQVQEIVTRITNMSPQDRQQLVHHLTKAGF